MRKQKQPKLNKIREIVKETGAGFRRIKQINAIFQLMSDIVPSNL